jgi:hypothetical protein
MQLKLIVKGKVFSATYLEDAYYSKGRIYQRDQQGTYPKARQTLAGDHPKKGLSNPQ